MENWKELEGGECVGKGCLQQAKRGIVIIFRPLSRNPGLLGRIWQLGGAGTAGLIDLPELWFNESKQREKLTQGSLIKLQTHNADFNSTPIRQQSCAEFEIKAFFLFIFTRLNTLKRNHTRNNHTYFLEHKRGLIKTSKGLLETLIPWMGDWVTRFSVKASKPVIQAVYTLFGPDLH